VVRGQPTQDKDRRKEQLQAYAALMNRLAGGFVTSVDAGTSLQDMMTMKQVTKWVAGLPKVRS
jgi:glutamate dehydrogenase/leucine dehydrogenase